MNKEELIKEYDEKAKALRDEFISRLEVIQEMTIGYFVLIAILEK